MTKKTVLITGCSTGIGYAVAKGLHERGYRVLATCRKQEDVDRLIGEGLESFVIDLQDSESIRLGFEELHKRTGGELWGLFNNGGYGQMGAVEDLSREDLRANFETNVFGWQEMMRYAMKIFRKQGYGRIIQNSSVLGIVAMPFRGSYNATKFATEGLADTMRLEMKKNPEIFISLVEPGPILSDFRAAAHRSLVENIDMENSVHRNAYRLMEKRLVKDGPAVPGTLGPDAVLKKVIHALEAKRPKNRYFVTYPTYMYAIMKRLMHSRWLDRYLQKH